MSRDHIAIVGAGIAGLTSAALLARHGRVTVYERDDRIGGKVRQEQWGDRGIDCGPTVFTLKPIFERIFRLCGERLEDHVTLKPLEVLARHAWRDGSALDLFADRDASADAIAAFAGPKEADAYRAYLNMTKRVWESLYGPMIEQPEASLVGVMARMRPDKMVRLNPYISLWQELSLRFKDERLRQLFGRYATYCGSSPFKAPGVMSMISHIEQEGVWTLEGGLRSLAVALYQLAESQGVTFETGTHVQEIETSASGVKALRTDKSEPASIIVYNGDMAALNLTGGLADTSPAAATMRAHERSQSALTLCFKGRAEGRALATHNVLFSDNYRAEFDDVFKRHRVPERPTVYVFAPDAEESRETPQRFFCLINAPADGDRHTYSEEEERQCQSQIFHQLDTCGVTLTPDPGSMIITTPTTFANRFPGTGGALFGKATHGWRAPFQRGSIRTKIRGLYCAGGSVHPGSGVPMAALSGLMAAQAIIQDYGLTSPSTLAVTRGGILTR